MKINLLLVGVFLLVMLAPGCHNKKEGESATDQVKTIGAETSSAASLPFLSSQEINTLYSIAEQVDIIFYKLPISVSQDDPASAKNTVLYISPAAPKITSQCEPLGRLSWISDGKIVRDADFYIGEGCNYFVFIENEKPVYQNSIGLEGVQYFQTIMSQVRPPDKK